MFKNTGCFATYKNEIFNWTKRFDLRFDLIGNKIADKITSLSKNPFKELHNCDEIKEEDAEKPFIIKDTYLQKKDNKLLMN